MIYRKDRDTVIEYPSLKDGAAFLSLKYRVPILPVLIENADLIYTQINRSHYYRSVSVKFGNPIIPEAYQGDIRELTNKIADDIRFIHYKIRSRETSIDKYDIYKEKEPGYSE